MAEKTLEKKVEELIAEQVKAIGRPDLFREPLVGFSAADDERYPKLKETIGSWHLNPRELFPEAETVISYFVPFTKEVAEAPGSSDQVSPLWGTSYAVLNSYFDKINAAVAEMLEAEGYASYAIQATHTYNEADMKSLWSHRSAAAAAGLGAFGANRMLISDKGCAGRYCTLLTAARLEPTRREPVQYCLYIKNGSCGKCFDVCPVHALHPDGIDRPACQKVTRDNEQSLKAQGVSDADVCGRCVSVCPFAYME